MNLPDCTIIECEQLSRKERIITKCSELLHGDLLDILSYNPDSGIFTWIKPPRYHPRMNGKIAGSISHGYILIQIYGFKFKAHRLAWFYIYGEWPNIIDHINRNKSDNRICNLRNCSVSENAKNHSKVKNNSGLPTGVRTNKASGRYQARISLNGKLIQIGTFDKIEDAEFAYKQKRNELYGEFAPI